MKILIVASINPGDFMPFVKEQAQSLKDLGINIDFFGISKPGILGYIQCFSALKKKIKEFQPDLIHAHYGLSALLANAQRKIPVIATYHGSDIHQKGYRLFLSKIAMNLSAYNIFVTRKLQQISGYTKKNFCILPCGIDFNVFYQIPREEAQRQLGWNKNKINILFAGAYENKIKNALLAKQAVTQIPNCNLIEMKGHSREKVNLLMNACNALLMTSFNEASPMVIKEALACGCPIVSVDVGDVKEITKGVIGCHIVERNASEIKEALNKTFTIKGKTNGREKLQDYSLENIAKQLLDIYTKLKDK